jgi:hypothetical protein
MAKAILNRVKAGDLELKEKVFVTLVKWYVRKLVKRPVNNQS